MSEYNVDYSVVKKPNQEKPLTKEEEKEWIRCADDPFYFFTNYCRVITPKGRRLFEARDYQQDLLDDIVTDRFLVVNAPRQCGKTTLLALYAVWCTIFQSSFTVGVTSFKNKNVLDIMSRCKSVYEHLPSFLKPPVKLYNQFTVEFTNGSCIYGEVTSENALRGRTNNIVIADEFAFCSPMIADGFYTALLPSLSAEGEDSETKVIFISTPNGSSGLYATLCFGAMSKINGYKYHQVDHTRIKGRTKKFEEDMIKKLGKNKYLQEFTGAFLSDKGTLINSRTIEAIETRDPVTTMGDLNIFVDSIRGRKLMMACDVSEGIGQDSHAFQIFDIDTLEQVAEYENNELNQTHYTKTIIRTIEYMWKEGCIDLYYTVENNGVGNGVLRLLENNSNEYLEKSMLVSTNIKKTGVATTGSSKKEGCAQFKDLCEMEKLKIYSDKLKTQLKFFVKAGNTFKAENGTHDDLVMACIVMMNMMKLLADYEEDVYETVNEVSFEDDEDFTDIYF